MNSVLGTNRNILYAGCGLVGTWCAYFRNVGWRGEYFSDLAEFV